LLEYYNYIKSLHLIFVITWFAGLFYTPRLFVYIIEASKKPPPNNKILTQQLILMAKRLWFIITFPSAILASFFGFFLLYLLPNLLDQNWMWIKLIFIALLYCYHIKCHLMLIKFQKNKFIYSSFFMRIWNEVPTLILFSIIFLVILKNGVNWIFGVLGIIVISILLMVGIWFYKKRRKN